MLISFFQTLKNAGIPVSIKEYLIMLEALNARIAFASVDDFYLLSRTCLVKDELQEGSTGEFPSSGNLVNWVSQRRSPIPAVTHVDYSARIQTVTPENPAHLILDGFFRETNVPVLVNTSFNVRGEPIVDSPADAIKCFLSTDMDCLVFDGVIVDKERQPESLLAEQNIREQGWELD